jgi:glycosyltransferase involved in cell wall biosynthesis
MTDRANVPGLLPALPHPAVDRKGWPWTEEVSPTVYRGAPRCGAWPGISIVCPSFRQGRYIEEAIRSVLLQNYPNSELIVMDGGSDDETEEILQKYSPWLKCWESTVDGGQSHALNKGYVAATGEIYGWINSDDYYLPGAFAEVASNYRRGRRELLHGDWMERVDEEPTLHLQKGKACFAFQVAVGGRTLPSHATFWPALVHQRFDETLRFTMDADFFKRLTARGVKPRHIPRPLGVFRRHAAAKSSTMEEVARTETEAWSGRQAWHSHWRWLLSRLIDRIRP